jgi:CzcA family heavy metal efflux pump
MMRAIVRWSLRFRFLVLASAIAMMVVGAGQIGNMPLDVFPEFAPPRVEIQTEAIGLSTTEVEELITVPLEQALQGTPQLKTMRSKSVLGLSSILMLFEPETDLILARQLVQERLTAAMPTLPNVAKPPVMLQPLSSTARTMKIGIRSDTLSVTDLSELVRFTIRPRLLGVPGVANVSEWGQRKRQFHVQVDPERLAALGVSHDQVLRTTSDAMDVGLLTFSSGAIIGTGGWIDSPNQRLGIRHVLPITTPEDLAKVVVSGTNLRLGDVATVVEGHQPLIGDGVIDGGPGLLLIVEKFPWANTLDVTNGVDAALETLRPGLPDVVVDATIFRPATFIELALENLTRALLIGCALVALVLALFLFEWRTAAISLLAIPLSLLAAILVLDWRGATINTMVLAGFVIAVGVVVDDAIIDVENIVRRLRQHRLAGTGKSTASVILEASLEVRSAIVYATLIDVVVLIPVFYMEGLAGSFFRPLALSYGLAVLASMGVALTVTPALALMLLRKAPVEHRESPLVRKLQGGYQGILSRAVRTPRPAYALVAATMVVGALVWPMLGQSLLPKFKERDFLMHWVTQPGTSLGEMTRITIESAKELSAIPGVRNFGAHIGQATVSDEVVGIHFTENWISIDPNADYDKAHAAVQTTVDGYPGLYRDVQTYLQERVKEVLSGTSDTIVVRIYGSDLAVLREKAAEVKNAMAEIPGIVDLHTELVVEEPQIEIKTDLAAAQRHGLKPGDIIRAAGGLVNGVEVGDIFWEGKVYDAIVIGAPNTRQSVTSLQEMLIDTPNGGHVRLKDVAQVRVTPAPNVVKRENASRRLDVGANVRGRDLGAVSRDVEARVAAISFPREYHPEILGEYAERQAAQQRLLAYAGAAVVGLFLLLVMAYGSWRLAILSFLTLPSALVGGVLAAYLGSGVLSLGSLVGFLTVLGIAARNGIMMINHYQHLERHEGETFGPGLVLRGARERLSPILMTALATGLALIPLIVLGDIPGHEIELPMAIVILGGLITSTLLNLFVLPSLYLRFAQPSAATETPQVSTGMAGIPVAGTAGGGQ